MSDDLEPAEETVTDRLAEAADHLDALLMMVAGYRSKAVEAGFSEFSAEEMAVQVHAKLLDS
jgi:hypothetical protein